MNVLIRNKPKYCYITIFFSNSFIAIFQYNWLSSEFWLCYILDFKRYSEKTPRLHQIARRVRGIGKKKKGSYLYLASCLSAQTSLSCTVVSVLLMVESLPSYTLSFSGIFQEMYQSRECG